MSLATRCPACQTVFRVVQDQLRVSEGWVRCGRCAEVFNALEQMVEVAKPVLPATAAAAPGAPAYGTVLDTPAPSGPPTSPARPEPPPMAPPPALPAGTPDLSDMPPPPGEAVTPAMSFAPLPHPAEALSSGSALPQGVVAAHEELYEAPADEPPAWAEAAPVPAEDRAVEADPGSATRSAPVDEWLPLAAGGGAAADPDPLAVVPAHDAADALVASAELAVDDRPTATSAVEIPAAAAVDADAATPLPGFLRRAQRAERWQRPAVRRTLAAVLALGLVALAVQTGLAYRDLLAARWPQARSVLAPLCAALGCRIEQPRWIDAVVVDSTGLTRLEGSAYRLSVVMRNRSAMAVALPAVDLMLTDTQGRLVARRTLTARELGATATALPAQAELTLQAMLQVAGGTVAGYTIEVFYP